MQENQPLINAELYDPAVCEGLLKKFNTGEPIRHLVIDNFLDKDLAQTLFSHFPDIRMMKTHYHGLNEEKAEHSDFGKLHPGFSQLHKQLTDPEFIKWLERITGIHHFQVMEDRLGYGLHQGADQSFLDIHIDYNLHPVTKLYRKLNLILFLNQTWEDNWGGSLELWDKKVENCIQSILPVFNRCAIFECSDYSYHGYSKINVPAGITRKSAYQYYFIPASSEDSYHDTIFKTRPDDSRVKKVKTYSKDLIKNMIKRTFYVMGLKRFLK